MPVKLTDKEISAIAKKLADQKKKVANKKIAEVTKRKIPEAKKLLSLIESLPDEVVQLVEETRYNKSSRNVQVIAERLARKEEMLDKIESKDFEPDIILAAHSCNSMAQLCTKLGI